jgi:hypothetical protein
MSMDMMTMAGGESSDANENNSGSRASMRRVLPPLPGQPQSLTVSTTSNPTPCSSNNSNGSGELLGSRGEVEGSSNQPSPTCVSGEIDPGYWSSVRCNTNHDEMMSTNTTPVKAHHDLLIDDLNRTKKQLAELQNMVSFH